MINCPMCGAMSEDEARKCKKCQADLALLADYVAHLRSGLGEAEKLTREGNLGEAVWAYLAVLEVDPDNTTARRQVGKVVTAVRQFDSTSPGMRWLPDRRNDGMWGRWFGGGEGDENGGWWAWALAFLLIVTGVVMAYSWGVQTGRQMGPPAAEPDAKKETK